MALHEHRHVLDRLAAIDLKERQGHLGGVLPVVSGKKHVPVDYALNGFVRVACLASYGRATVRSH